MVVKHDPSCNINRHIEGGNTVWISMDHYGSGSLQGEGGEGRRVRGSSLPGHRSLSPGHSDLLLGGSVEVRVSVSLLSD